MKRTTLALVALFVAAVLGCAVGLALGPVVNAAQCPTEDSCRPAYEHGVGWVGIPVRP